MLHKLTDEQIPAVRPLFEPLDDHLAVASSLAGDTPCEVYVDSASSPSAAVLFPANPYRVYVAGDTQSPRFAADLVGLLAERAAASANPGRGEPVEMVLYFAPHAWEAALATALAAVQQVRFRRIERHYYRLDLRREFHAVAAPAGFTIRRISQDVLSDEHLSGREELASEIRSESPSVESFLAHRFGFCARYENELAGSCCSEYNTGGRCELGIVTVERFRRRGVALATASATVEYAHQQGIETIGWDCWAGNEASIGLALRLGFALVHAYPVLYCQFGV